MMYWWPRLEQTIKRLIWLVATLLVGLGASRVQKDTRLGHRPVVDWVLS